MLKDIKQSEFKRLSETILIFTQYKNNSRENKNSFHNVKKYLKKLGQNGQDDIEERIKEWYDEGVINYEESELSN